MFEISLLDLVAPFLLSRKKGPAKIAVPRQKGCIEIIRAIIHVLCPVLSCQGYEVVGVFMRNWDIADETGFCSADKDAEAAEDVANKLQIPFREVNFVAGKKRRRWMDRARKRASR